jgi:methanethiol S-methyltransferase
MIVRRIAAAVFGLVAYAASMVAIAYLIGFVGDLPLPRTVNRGAGPIGPAPLVNILLILLFGVQHSVMARPGFKARLARVFPPELERATFGLVTSLVLALLFWLWRPVPLLVWDLTGSWAGHALNLLFWGAWGTAVGTTFALGHPHLFGLSQLADYLRLRKLRPANLRTPAIYRVVRHPMTAALIVAFWAAPRMTVGHLILAVGLTAYSLVGTVLEERDLIRSFGERYRQYRREVPALVPCWQRVVRGPRRAAGFAAVVLALAVLGAWAVSAGTRPDAARGPVAPESAATAPGWGGAAGADGAAEAELSLEVDGRQRRAMIVIPEGLTPEAPLVLAYHGSGGSPERFRRFLGGELERLAGSDGFVLAYPEAFGGRWHECRAEAPSAARRLGVDDVAFSRALIGELVRAYGIDRTRVYAVGFSGGGHMAYRMALEAPDAVAGVAVIAANLVHESQLGCFRAGDLPPLSLVVGTADLINPYRGGQAISPTGVPLGRVRSAEASALYFARGTGRAPRKETDVQPDTGTALERTTWYDGACPVARLHTVRGGGHTVPGPASRFPRVLGKTDPAFPAVAAALDFLVATSECAGVDGRLAVRRQVGYGMDGSTDP